MAVEVAGDRAASAGCGRRGTGRAGGRRASRRRSAPGGDGTQPDGIVGRVSASWSTVVLTLGGIVATGVATAPWRGSRGARSAVRPGGGARPRRPARSRAHFAAAEDATRYAIDHRGDAGARDNAAHLAGEVTRQLGPVALLFGDRAPAVAAARQALEELKLAAGAAREERWSPASAHLEAAVEQRRQFMDGVLAEVAEGWRPPA